MFPRKCFIWMILCSIYGITRLYALTCYMCPRSYGQTQSEANIECLALGWELSCARDQDRCYSRFYPETVAVEKGCTQSQQCVEATSCCENSYCNADAQTSQTGYGRPCSFDADCIQGGNEMVCAREVVTDVSKLCLCADDSYQRGSTCKRKSYPGFSCMESRHCYDVNSTCIRRRCTCDEGMFANGTRCSYQTKLGEPCQFDRGCIGHNTVCTDKLCTCTFGFLVVNGTDNCSGSSNNAYSNGMVTWALATVLFSFVTSVVRQGE